MIRLVPSIVCLIVGGGRALTGEFSLGELIAFFSIFLTSSSILLPSYRHTLQVAKMP